MKNSVERAERIYRKTAGELERRRRDGEEPASGIGEYDEWIIEFHGNLSSKKQKAIE